MRVCPACRTKYDEGMQTCPRDGMPLLELSRTFARLNKDAAEDEPPEPEDREESEESADIAVGPGMMVGEYMVERTIAEGGMGAIYAGIHPVISKRVAIKVISKRYAQDPKAVARFVLEARSVNQIGHHNIVDIFSIGELDDRRNYLVMELLDGMAMNQVLQRVKRLRPGEVLSVYEQLCDALDAAHKKGFIHRDLKPDNVIVLRRPPRPFIKILDFGLAKLRGAALSHNTEVGTVLGTPEYMAPEQCRGSHVDARTDIYALGVMLYELLAGQKPFTDPSPLRILAMQQHAQPTPLGRLVQISSKLEAVVSRAMDKDPTARYPSTKELIQDLRVAIPEPMPWTAEMVSWGDGQSGSSAAVTEPPQAKQPSLPPLQMLQPLSISGELAPTSGELDDNVETLVSEQKIHETPERPAPRPIARVASAEVEDEPRTEVDPAEEPLARLQPQPALAAESSDEIAESEAEGAESTLVDDNAPIVLVDRPIRETRTAESAEFLLDLAPPAAPAENKPVRSLEVDVSDLGTSSRESSEPGQRPPGKRPTTPPVGAARSPTAPPTGARSQPSREELAMGKTLPATEMPAELRRAIQAGVPPESLKAPKRSSEPKRSPEAFGSARKPAVAPPPPRRLHPARLLAIVGIGVVLLVTVLVILLRR
jgi:serine/threonine-protein kinase